LAGRLREQNVELHAARYAPDALVIDEGAPLRLDLDDSGLFFVQDEASQLVSLLAGDHPPARVLDACASPGGKTTAIAAAMAGRGLLVATDLRDRRINLLKRAVVSSGATNVRIVQTDLRKPLPFSVAFDCVLVDAPCSGLGTLRRDPDIRWRRQESEVPALAAAELTMLRQAADVVAPGGRLIYATCSSEPEENEQIVDAFAALMPAFATVPVGAVAPRLSDSLVDARGCLRTEPHRHQLES